MHTTSSATGTPGATRFLLQSCKTFGRYSGALALEIIQRFNAHVLNSEDRSVDTEGHIFATHKYLSVSILENLRGGNDGLRYLADLRSLEQLGFSRACVPSCVGPAPSVPEPFSLSDEGLIHLKSLPSLRILNVQDSQLTDAGMKHIACLGNLRELSLRNTKVTSAGVVYLKTLGKLRTLDVGETEIDDQGLAVLSKMTSLEVLTVRGTKVTDAGLLHLASLPDLRVLNVSETGVTKNGIERLRRKLPNCTVLDEW